MRSWVAERVRNRWTIVLLAAIIVFSSAYAFAGSRGAGNASSSSCATSVTGSYGVQYASSIPGYRVNSISLNDISTCAGQTIMADLTGVENESLVQISHLVTTGEATAGTVAVPVGGTIDAAGVSGVSVALAG